VFVLVVVGDLASKAWLFSQPALVDILTRHRLGLPAPETAPGWPEWIQLTYNPGVAWGLGGRWPAAVLLLTVLLIPLLGWVWWRWFRLHGRTENLAFACILGGASGNLWDRLLTGFGIAGYHGVRDFLRIDLNHLGIDYIWPNFNLADAAISTGFVLLVALALRKPASQPAVPASHSSGSDSLVSGPGS